MLKKLIPLSIRNQLRPAYLSIKKRFDLQCKVTKEQRKEWDKLRTKLPSPDSYLELYQFAQQEFGVLQVESEITSVLEFVASQKPVVVGEIGLKHSGNSFLFTQAFQETQCFIGLDLQLNNTEKVKALAPGISQYEFLEGGSYEPQTIQNVKSILNGRQFDFLFIDGDHSYDGAVADFLSYYSLVKPGGFIGFHDIVPDEVAKFGVKPEESQCYGGDVYKIWKKLCPHFEHHEFVESWEQIGFGIGIIVKMFDNNINDVRKILDT